MSKQFSESAGRATPSRHTTAAEDGLSRRVSVNGSQSLSDLSFTPHDNFIGITIINRGTADIHYSAVGGTAGTTHAGIAAGASLEIECSRAKSAFIRLYSAAAQDVDLIESLVIQDSPYTTT